MIRELEVQWIGIRTLLAIVDINSISLEKGTSSPFYFLSRTYFFVYFYPFFFFVSSHFCFLYSYNDL